MYLYTVWLHLDIFFNINFMNIINKITCILFPGLIHLESLELLSKQCQMKLQTVLLSYSGTQLTDIQDKLDQIKDLCYLDFDDDEKIMTVEEFKSSLITCINHISTDVKIEKILRVGSYIFINIIMNVIFYILC